MCRVCGCSKCCCSGPTCIYENMQSLAIVYGAVIDDVLSKVRSEFVQEGVE